MLRDASGRSNNSFARRTLEGICVLCWLGNVSFADTGLANPGAAPANPTNIFAPASTPADSIFGLSLFVLAVTAAIFVLVASLLVYCVVKFRNRKDDDGREPPQVYGSNQVELAWTVIPVLIVVALFMATARVIATVQNHERPDNAVEVVADRPPVLVGVSLSGSEGCDCK